MKPIHILLAVLIAAIWGFNFVVIRFGLDNFPPLLFSALRFAAASIPFILFYRNPGIKWRWVLGIGFALGIAKFSLLFIGMDMGMPPGLSSLVLQTQVFFTVILAAMLIGERPNRNQIIGMFLSFSGIAVLASHMQSGGNLFAFSLVILAAVFWGVSNIMMKHSKPENMVAMIVWISLVPPLPLLGLSWVFEGPELITHAINSLNTTGLLSIFYIAIISTVIGFGAWGFLLKHYTASQVTPFALLVPIFGISSSALVFGETLAPVQIIGSLIVGLGLIINLWRMPSDKAIQQTA